MRKHIVLLISVLLLGCAQAIAQDYVPTPVTISTEKVRLNGKVYYSHLVLERQTVFSIAKAYGVSAEDLYQANPHLRENGLQKGGILLVPVTPGPETETVTEPAVQQPAYKEHTVRWYEDIDDIARKYGVTPEAIMQANNLKSRKLSTRQVLRIPDKNAVLPEVPVVPENPAQADTLSIPAQEVKDTLVWKPQPKDGVNFALLLPLKAQNGNADSNMDFYSGVLMALRDLDAQGIKVNMHVHDLYAGIPEADVLTREDFVLGPVASRDLEAILQRVDGRVSVISPLDQKAAGLKSFYRNFIQAPASAENQYENLAAWVQEDSAGEDKILFVTEKGASNIQASVGIRTAMANRGITYDILSYSVSRGRSIPDSLSRTLVKTGVNRVVVASESEPFVGDVVRNLGILLGRGYQIVMYAPSRIRNFDSIDGSALHDLSAHISTAYHVNYGSPKVDQFVHAYRALFRTEPTQFAFQGYDTARFFVLAMTYYGHSWKRYLNREPDRGLHTDFLFVEDGDDNLHNTAIRRIVYQPDYTTTLIQ